MANVVSRTLVAQPKSQEVRRSLLVLQFGFVVAPIIAGLDKLSLHLTNWEAYLSPVLVRALGDGVSGAMRIIGLVEVSAGLLVALRPKIGGYVVAAWLLGITANLVISGKYFDIALRDFGLSLAAIALARLASISPEPS